MLKQIKFFVSALNSLFINGSSVNSELNIKHFSYKDTTSLFYELQGKGKYTVLIIPGFSQSLESWAKVAKMFSEDYQTIVLELPNKGKRKENTALWNEKEFADFCLEFIHKYIKGKIILIGHSLGGKIAAIISLSLQNRIRLLVLYAVGGMNAHFSLEKRIIKILKNLLYQKTSTINFSSIYKKVSVPILLIYGQDDWITPAEVGREISSTVVVRTKLKIIPHATHLAHKEYPDVFIKYIKDEL
jgi:pimeloyl-ACP methyl ester carboxylesterase